MGCSKNEVNKEMNDTSTTSSDYSDPKLTQPTTTTAPNANDKAAPTTTTPSKTDKDNTAKDSEKKSGLSKYNIAFNDEYLKQQAELAKKSNVSEDENEKQNSQDESNTDINSGKGENSNSPVSVSNVENNSSTPVLDNSLAGTVTENNITYASEEDKNLIGTEVITQVLPDEPAVSPDWGGVYYDSNEDVGYVSEQDYIDYEESKNDNYIWVDGEAFLTQEDADNYKKGSESVSPSYTIDQSISSESSNYFETTYERYVAEDGTVYYFSDEESKALFIGSSLKSASVESSEIFIPQEEEVVSVEIKEINQSNTKTEEPVAEVKEDTKVEKPTSDVKEDTKVEKPTSDVKEDTKVEEKEEQNNDSKDENTKVEEPNTPSESENKEIDNTNSNDNIDNSDQIEEKSDNQITDVVDVQVSSDTYVVPNDSAYGVFAGTEWVSKEDFELVWQSLQADASELADTAESVKTR